jgi:hypothetical protein
MRQNMQRKLKSEIQRGPYKVALEDLWLEQMEACQDFKIIFNDKICEHGLNLECKGSSLARTWLAPTSES